MFANNYVAFYLAYKITFIRNAALPCTERILTDRMSPQRTDMLTGVKLKTTFLYLVNHAFKIRALPLNFIAIKTKIYVYYLQMVSDY